MPKQTEEVKPEVKPAEPAAPAVQPVENVAPPPEKMVKVRPRVTEPRCRIGGAWYSFTSGKEVAVPRNVVQVLRERNLI